MFRSAFILTVLLGASAPAFASTPFTATLETPVAERVRLVADSSVWVCEGTSCSSVLQRTKPTAKACKAFAKEAGRVTAYGTAGQALTEAEIADCNTRAK